MKNLIERYNIHKAAKHQKSLDQACPVAAVNKDFAPSKIFSLAQKAPASLLKENLLWDCLACGLCNVVSEGEIEMSQFIRDARKLAVEAGNTGSQTHGGLMLSAQRISAKESAVSRNNEWLDKSLKYSEDKGKHLYWAGGARFLDAALPELKTNFTESARSAVAILNRLGIKPALLKNERFSGHDLLWTGDVENFRRLAEKNIAAIKKSGAEEVIVSSPEDFYTLSVSYPEHFGDLDIEIHHISEFIAERLSELEFKDWRRKAVYHDPCRLGRGMGVYDAPREILRAIPGLELAEMNNSRENALCCGTSCWTNCNKYSKLMQINRLREAAAAGAETLVTSCWECEAHFRCATRSEAWRQVFVEINDLVTLAASLLK